MNSILTVFEVKCMELGIMSFVAITAICYLVGLIVKATPFNNDKYIPIACGLAGYHFTTPAAFRT